MSNESQLDEDLKKSVSAYSPEAQKNKAIAELVNSKQDSMFDLTEEQITSFALFRALDENIIDIPGTMAFLENFASLTRSKDRIGRYEYMASHAQRVVSYVKPMSPSEQVSQPAPMEQPQQKKGSGLFSWLKGGRK